MTSKAAIIQPRLLTPAASLLRSSGKGVILIGFAYATLGLSKIIEELEEKNHSEKTIASINRHLFVFPVKPELSRIWHRKVRLSSDQISINAIGRAAATRPIVIFDTSKFPLDSVL